MRSLVSASGPLISFSTYIAFSIGTGKTVMILALVLATLGEISKPEVSAFSNQQTLTPVAFYHFPWSPFSQARNQAFYTHELVSSDNVSVPSLIEMLLHYICVEPGQIGQPRMQSLLEDGQQLQDMLQKNIPFYLQFKPLSISHSQRQLDAIQSRPRIVYLTSATLITVPPNMLLQWASEICKHCHPGLRVILIKPEDALPCATTLASCYDVCIPVIHTI